MAKQKKPGAYQSAEASTPRPKAMLWTAIGLLAAFVVMAFAVGLNPSAPFTQGLDAAWRGVIGASPDDTLHTGPLAMFFQYLGEIPGAVLTVLVIPIALVIVGRWRSSLFFLSAVMLGPALISQVTKNLVDRPRPATDEALGLFGPLFMVDHGSFPSGHAVTAGAVTFAVAALIPSGRRTLRKIWWVIGALIMVGMIWQRTLINAHWLSDAVFGLIAGVVGVLLMWWAFWPLLRADYGRPVWFLHRGERASEPGPLRAASDEPAPAPVSTTAHETVNITTTSQEASS
mgnify:FL=1